MAERWRVSRTGECLVVVFSRFSLLSRGLVLLPRWAGSVEEERSLSGRFLEIASASPCLREGTEGDLLFCLTRDCF